MLTGLETVVSLEFGESAEHEVTQRARRSRIILEAVMSVLWSVSIGIHQRLEFGVQDEGGQNRKAVWINLTRCIDLYECSHGLGKIK